MKKQALLLSLFFSIHFLFAGIVSAQTDAAADTNSPAISQAQEMLRSNLHLQEQLHTALRAIEQARQDADSSSKKNAELFTEKLNSVEKTLAMQRERDLETIISTRESNRVALIAAAVIAVVGILALFLTAYFQVRAMNRMTEIGALISSSVAVAPHREIVAGNFSAPAQLNSADQANARFLAAVEQLEKRIHELDGTNFGSGQTKRLDLAEPRTNGESNEPAKFEAVTNAESLLEKGQSLLNGGEPEKALACFEEALKTDSVNTDAWVKKGSALEALRKLPEAIEAYDRAIATDRSLTVAYLYKGGVLNRLQRFEEAMACYEQALGTPKKAA